MTPLTDKQREALRLIGGPAQHIMLFGGSRSGKTTLLTRAVILRALAADRSRHAILRFRFNHVKQSIVLDTFPKVMGLWFPDVDYRIDKSDWYAEFSNESQIWFGGLDDKDRTEKVLGQEHATLYLNEASQIPFSSRNLALTRLAQRVDYEIDGVVKHLRLKCFYDCNPPLQTHWTYKLFVQRRDPDTNRGLPNPEDYANMRINPIDNQENLAEGYLDTLKNMPARMRLRFLEGEFGSITDDAYWSFESIDKWRTANDMPDMQRVVVAVDPSGANDSDAPADAIGIVVAGLGVDGNAYVLEDLTVKAGPKVWGNVVATAYDRHMADKVIGESNYGGEMVRYVVQTSRPGTPVKLVNATRGKVVRAEPISALSEQGRVRFAGFFPELEEELCSFSQRGYLGTGSPNRADAFVWAMTELFPGIISQIRTEEEKEEKKPKTHYNSYSGPGSWMG